MYLENTLKLFLCLITGVGITAIEKIFRTDFCCFFLRGVDLPHPLFITWGMTVPEVARYTL